MIFFQNLFKPGWMNKNYDKAQKAFCRVKKRNAAAEIIQLVLTCPHDLIILLLQFRPSNLYLSGFLHAVKRKARPGV